MKRSEILFSVLLLPLDFLALLSSFVLAYYIRDEFTLVAPQDVSSLANKFNYTASDLLLSFDKYLYYLSFIIPAMLVIFALTGLYAIRSRTNWLQRFLQIFIGVSVGEFFILLLFLLKKSFFLPRATVLYSWILCTFLVFIGRLLMRAVQKFLYSRGIGVTRLGVIGKNESALNIIKRLTQSRFPAYRIAFHLDSIQVEEIITQIDGELLDELIVVSAHYKESELIALRNHCLEHGVGFSFVPPLLTELQSAFEVTTIGNLPMIEVRPTPLEGWGRVIKRVFDVVAGVLLVILFSPVFLMVAILLKVVSPGPLLYKHTRIGKDKQPIKVWKFRSMRWEYCDGPQGHPDGDKNFAKLLQEHPALAQEWKETVKLKNDPRVSWVGKFIRKTSLDELPQFFNVLAGSLSLVGPRPIVEKEVEKYGEKARILFTVKPGVTGLWQVSGRNDVSYEERIALDSHYIEHWNLWEDIIILFRTAFVILNDLMSALFKNNNGKGAY